MQYRTFPATGDSLSVLGFGAMGFAGWFGAVDDAEAIRSLHTALDLGVNVIDTARAYGRSEQVAEAFKCTRQILAQVNAQHAALALCHDGASRSRKAFRLVRGDARRRCDLLHRLGRRNIRPRWRKRLRQDDGGPLADGIAARRAL